jgi:hypothetical protein
MTEQKVNTKKSNFLLLTQPHRNSSQQLSSVGHGPIWSLHYAHYFAKNNHNRVRILRHSGFKSCTISHFITDILSTQFKHLVSNYIWNAYRSQSVPRPLEETSCLDQEIWTKKRQQSKQGGGLTSRSAKDTFFFKIKFIKIQVFVDSKKKNKLWTLHKLTQKWNTGTYGKYENIFNWWIGK